MEIFKISAIILIAVVLINSLPLFDKSINARVTITICILITVYLINKISPVISVIKSIIQSNTDADFTIVFKAIGIRLITQFVSDIALDSGNKALANQMIFVGKLSIMISAMPIFIKVLEIIGQFTR